MKRLYKSETNRVFSGLIGGVGEYFDVDPVLLRVAFIILMLATAVFPGIIAYILCSLVVPKHSVK